ncbi:HYC_CC_PP family protein [Shivajiella indica]|uniref:Uncharacterized protein n=1 Tax=Shivajiella indica TaxID=872115 RepID=A0ABW5BCX0_9BACT
MKKFIKIALLFFYVFFNAGLSYSMHFCGEDFKRINVFADYKTCCESKTPMPGCCDDVSNLEIPNNDQQVSEILDFHPMIFELITFDFSIELVPHFVKWEEKIFYSDSSPPIIQETPIYIFCQVFLI